MNNGYFVISLDFELMWGNIESWTIGGYGSTHVVHVREVIERLLTLFERYQVRATFATVGLIMQQSHHDISGLLPDKIPSYKNPQLSPYENHSIECRQHPKMYFAPDVIERLKKSPAIEIGTHTYGHYYCWEEGQTKEQFEADIQKAVDVAFKNGIQLKSIVFPRNQVSEDYLEICKKHGIVCYRGNAQKYFDHTSSLYINMKNRICRLLDAYLNIGGNTSYTFKDKNTIIQNIPASRFLRPYTTKLAFIDGLRLKRIINELEYAAIHREIYHLWWHPHNFGQNIDKNIAFLEKILQKYHSLHERYQMQSMSMSDIYREYTK